MITCDYDFQHPVDDIIHTASLLLVKDGNAKAASILANSNGQLRYHQSEQSFIGDFSVYRLILGVPAGVFIRLDDCAEVQTQIAYALAKAMEPYVEANSFEVRIVAASNENADWRESLNRFLLGEGLTNQGRVRSSNIAAREHDGLLFRSLHEVHFYNALKGTGVPFAPLAVVLRGGVTYNRVEPDFLIFKDGIVMLVEIDGPVHFESPAAAHARLKFITDEGARLERIDYRECDSAEKAREAVRRILFTIDKQRRAR